MSKKKIIIIQTNDKITQNDCISYNYKDMKNSKLYRFLQ